MTPVPNESASPKIVSRRSSKASFKMERMPMPIIWAKEASMAAFATCAGSRERTEYMPGTNETRMSSFFGR